MKNLFVTMMILFVIILAACSSNNNDEGKTGDTEKEVPENIKEIVNDYSVGESKDESASITSTQLIVTDKDDEQITYDLPEDEFFVSIAPFINETHPCDNHSLTGCQGELVDQDFDIYIENTDGNVVLDETMNSEANGFIDLWLPRDKTFNVKISSEGKEVESQISTFEKDGTCITTMQLS